VATQAIYRRAREQLEQLSSAASDARVYRTAALDALRAAIGFDAHVWLLTDPSTAVGSDPHADVPALRELPTLIKYKYLSAPNRWTELLQHGVVAASLAAVTGNDLSRSRVWQQVMSQYGVTDVASVVLADRNGCWGFLDLWRTSDSIHPTFEPEELSYLAELAESMTAGLRHAQAATFSAIPADPVRESGPVVLLLNDDLQVQSQTPAAEGWLQTLVPGTGSRRPIPASVYNVAAQLLATESGVDRHEPRTRVHLADSVWLTARAARLGSRIVVSLEPSSPAERLDMFALAHGMSDRETELLRMLADGSDTRTIAERMFLSELTVQDHLKSVFAKSRTHNRRTLLAQIFGTRAG
jgi:DNA-binding CsgD family transcriptional regulator